MAHQTPLPCLVFRNGIPSPVLSQATECVEIKRPDGSAVNVHVFRRALRRYGGQDFLLACPYCGSLRRALYGWTPRGEYTSSAQTSTWQCRRCAGLRYASEGGGLVHRGRGAIARLFEAALGPCRSERPEPWYPYVFTSPQEAAEAGLCTLNGKKTASREAIPAPGSQSLLLLGTLPGSVTP